MSAFALLLSSALPSAAQTVTRLTTYAGDDFYPSWDPRGVNIAYLRPRAVGSNVFDAYKVLSSGQGGEQALLTGANTPFGVATTMGWLGNTGFLVVEEAISGFEVLKFDTAVAPFDRTLQNGSDSANTVLLSIDGGGGGGLSKISRNGLVALERVHTPGGAFSVRTGPVSSMAGQASSTFGTALVSGTGSSLYLNGGALNADGSIYVLATPVGSGYDLVLGSTTNAFASVNLTNTASSGMFNIFPDISPDGTKIVFERGPSSTGPFDLYTINTDGTGLTQITNTPNFSEDRPSWSPDGGSIAFDGVHLAGHETEFPALNAGEQPNYNIYLLTLPAANTVTPKTKLTDPPLVVVKARNVTFTCAPFLKASLTAASKVLKSLGLFATAKAKVSFKYNLELTKTGKKKTRKNILSSRNTFTVKNLAPGTYSARYRVQITSKVARKSATVKSTAFSPTAKFTVGS